MDKWRIIHMRFLVWRLERLASRMPAEDLAIFDFEEVDPEPKITPSFEMALVERLKNMPDTTVTELADYLGVEPDLIIDGLIRLGATS